MERKVQVRLPYQEDWGWELPVLDGSEKYYLCMSGNADDAKNSQDQGEWNIIIEKKRSIAKRLRGSGGISVNDKIVRTLEEILCAEPTIQDVRRLD